MKSNSSDRLCTQQSVEKAQKGLDRKEKTAFPVIASVSLGAALILKDVKEAIVKSMDFLLLEQICSTASKVRKKVREKSRECHNHKPQPFPDPRGRENRHIQTSTKRTNVRKALRLALSSPSEVIAILKRLKKNTRTK